MPIRRLALAILGLACSACVDTMTADVRIPEETYHSDASDVQMVSTFVGANVYIPSTVVVVGGRPYTLSVFNTTDQPHGFAIAGLGIEAVLEPKQETEVQLPALQGGALYRIHCQLHGAHRSATLVVLPGE
jgi:heme/copper-type cytochrome/quinol oxidase subunit 2